MLKTYKIGDYARSIETGWIGRIEEIIPTHVHGEPMVKMMGVDELARVVAGLTLEESLSSNDTRWYSPNDLEPVRTP